jgi:hypothetical protein
VPRIETIPHFAIASKTRVNALMAHAGHSLTAD